MKWLSIELSLLLLVSMVAFAGFVGFSTDNSVDVNDLSGFQTAQKTLPKPVCTKTGKVLESNYYTMNKNTPTLKTEKASDTCWELTNQEKGYSTQTCRFSNSKGCFIGDVYCDIKSNTGYSTRQGQSCPFGCKDGVCLKQEPAKCTETDGGKNFGKKGSLESTFSEQNRMSKKYETRTVKSSDSCMDYPRGYAQYGEIKAVPSCSGKNCYVEEWFCDAKSSRGYDISRDHFCKNGCKDGACIGE